MITAKEFTDWHIDVEETVDQSVAFPGQLRVRPEMQEIALSIAASIKKFISENPDRDRFVILDGDYRYRIQHIMGNKYAARRIGDAPTFEMFSYPKPIRDLLISKELQSKGGLVLVSGTPGSGKTSTVISTLQERLRNDGGFCLTAEDPPEYMIRGFHGDSGFCEQMDATDIGYEKALAVSLRSFPSKSPCMLFFGEVRTKSAAAELLRIAVDGHLVFTTVHADNIQSALQRLISLASSDGEDEARYLLSSSIRLVINQTFDPQGKLMISALECNEIVASIIRNKNADLNLSDSIKRTMNKVRAASEIATR